MPSCKAAMDFSTHRPFRRSRSRAQVSDREKSAVTVEILAKMVDTLDTSRDAELQGGYGFLNASAFPKITFKSTGIRSGEKPSNRRDTREDGRHAGHKPRCRAARRLWISQRIGLSEDHVQEHRYQIGRKAQ